MSQSPKSQHRASLIRQMAEDLNKSRAAPATSRGSSRASSKNEDSTGSSFDPENEAFASTRQLDDLSQRLPQLRASARKYKYPRSPEPDVQINTSAIGRAFPDFSQGPTSSENESQSIEIGRTAPANVAGPDHSSMGLGDSMDFSPAIYDKYKITRPAHSPEQAPRSRKETANLPEYDHQENKISHAIKASDHGSNGSRQSSGDHKLTLAQMHARVADERDATQLTEDRPTTTLDLNSRSSRFAHGRVSALPSGFSSTQVLLQSLSRSRSPKGREEMAQTTNATASSTNQGTQQSFMIPDMPNISELVSGMFEDGTPVFSANRNMSGTRATSQPTRRSGMSHVRVSSITIPEDEQAIYVSLQLLEDKVKSLEVKKAEAERLIQTLQTKNEILEREKAERRQLRRSDSALGMTSGSDAGDESDYRSRKATIERSRLQSTVQHLQEELSKGDKRIAQSESVIKELTNERDAAITQLGVAYFTTEQLKKEKQDVLEENGMLREELARVYEEYNVGVRSASKVTFENGPRTISQSTSNPGRTTVDDQDFTQILNVDTDRQARAMSNASHAERILASRPEEAAKPKEKKSRLVLEDYSESEVTQDSEQDTGTVQHNLPAGVRIAEFRSGRVGAVGDVSCLSSKSEYFDNLRASLEKERKSRRDRSQGREVSQTGISEVSAAVMSGALPRKSSLKDVTGRSNGSTKQRKMAQVEHDMTNQSRASSIQQHDEYLANDTIQSRASSTQQRHRSDKYLANETMQSRASSNQQRQRSERSLLEESGRRGRVRMEDMTSAFIVPDITIHTGRKEAMPQDHASPSEAGLISGEHVQNCTICRRVLEHGKPHTHASAQAKVTIPKPVPVSTRAPSPTPSNPDVTIRPAEAPGVALATVIKSISDEIVHLKAQLAKQNALYNRHDPALSKRKRQAVSESIAKLITTINTRSDQVYSLYDVLEGQKSAGQEMSELEIEVTLSEIGIDPSSVNVNLRGGGASSSGGKNASASSAGEETDEDVDIVGEVSSVGSEIDNFTEELAMRDSISQHTASTKSQRPLKPALKRASFGEHKKTTRVDAVPGETKKAGTKLVKEKRQPWDLDSDATDSLPWEGCESTADLTGRSRSSRGSQGSHRRMRSSD